MLSGSNPIPHAIASNIDNHLFNASPAIPTYENMNKSMFVLSGGIGWTVDNLKVII